MENNPRTEPYIAPVPQPVVPQAPQLQVERQGAKAEPYTVRYPQVRGGVCEFCGIIDPKVSSEHQYKLCQHYRGLQLRCSYCDENKNPDEVAGKSILNVAGSPFNPNELIVWCDSYECSRAHEARFKRK